jgi:antirestriction protein ArdC
MQTEKHDQIQQMTETAIEQLSQALAAGQSETLKRYLTAMAKFHHYSFGNQLLIAFQRPDATHVAGFHAWKKLNRFVKKGEKGILIMAPVTRCVGKVEETCADGKVESNEIRRIVNIKGVYVFDIGQTEGEPLPAFAKVTGDPADNTQKVKTFIESKGIALDYAKNLGGALGMSVGGKITLLAGQEPAAEFATLVHELAHEFLHRGERRTETSKKVRETEAEAVAFVVCQAVNLNTSTASSDYIQLYRGNSETLAESLQFIRTVASEIIGALAG